ncbi:MAG: MmcQ/YjbR family DNA-binding protein [Bryobacteraceae bacterium]|jgi:hypothetical protein
MTVEDFRRIALSFPDAVESAHMNHPDFRVNGRIFATMQYPDEAWAMVKLPPEEQENFAALDPAVFVPVKGAWGRQGCTNVLLKKAKEEALRGALTLAWQKASQKKRR